MGWGQWEEGIAGTIVKDTWTKSRGRVEVGKGREMGTSVIVSTIRKKKTQRLSK